MNDEKSVHWLEESEITFRNQMRRNWLLSNTGKWPEGNSQDTTHWNHGETHGHWILHAAVGTVSVGNKLSGRVAGGTSAFQPSPCVQLTEMMWTLVGFVCLFSGLVSWVCTYQNTNSFLLQVPYAERQMLFSWCGYCWRSDRNSLC